MQRKHDAVNIHGLQVQMQPVLRYAGAIWQEQGQELVVTSARDGMHSAGSLHYYGYAVDLRTRDFSDSAKRIVQKELQTALGSSYDVILESTHMHVEYNDILRTL